MLYKLFNACLRFCDENDQTLSLKMCCNLSFQILSKLQIRSLLYVNFEAKTPLLLLVNGLKYPVNRVET